MRIPKIVTLREEVIKAYKSECALCSESIPEFLILSKKNLAPIAGNSHDTYLRLKKLHWPKSYHLLCYNCKIPILFLRTIQKQIESERYTEEQAELFLGLREEARIVYGSKCQCCGKSRSETLIIDHLGKYLTKTGGFDELLAIKKLGWPKKQFRLLCYNCNRGIMRGKICPHEFNK